MVCATTEPHKRLFTGLTNGQHYLFSIYSQAWGNATDGRSADLSGTDTTATLTVDQQQYGSSAQDGLLVTCLYQATGTEAEFTIVPQNDSTWHLYGFSNRVAPARVVTIHPTGSSPKCK